MMQPRRAPTPTSPLLQYLIVNQNTVIKQFVPHLQQSVAPGNNSTSNTVEYVVESGASPQQQTAADSDAAGVIRVD